MFKKIISLLLCIMMLASILLITACGEAAEQETSDRIPTTLSVVGITEASTKEEDVKAVETAINKILKSRYKIAINLTLVTADEYLDLVESRIEQAQYNANVTAAINNYNSYVRSIAQREASILKSTSDKKKKWVKSNQTVISAATIATKSVYKVEQTTVYEDGTIETLYPEASSPIDIVMICGRDMYDKFDSMNLLTSLSSYLTNSFKKLKQFIYPTFFDQLKSMTGDICAIPNNNLLANYTYLVVNKELADKYEYNINKFTDFSDLSDFLASVNANETDITPFTSKPDCLGIYYAFNKDIAIGTYFNPLLGYDKEIGTTFEIKNLFDIPEYVSYLETMNEYTSKGYFDAKSDNFAVKVLVGDATIEALYGGDDSDYYVKVIQNPFVEEEVIFRGMFAISSYASNSDRAMEVIEAFNTDPDIKNLLQYGIEGVNYTVEDGVAKRLNNNYVMDNNLTGNIYMGYPEEGMSADAWKYVKQTNLDSSLSPFVIYNLTDNKLDSLMNSIITRVCMSEALANIDVDYDTYLASQGTQDFNRYQQNLRRYYNDFFTEELIKDGVNKNSTAGIISNLTNTKYTADWYQNRLVEKIKGEKYSTISTTNGITAKVKAEIANVVGVPYSKTENKNNSLEAYRESAAQYYTNIEYLRIMTKLTLFKDMSEAELEKYDNMSNTEFEKAVFEYVKQNYIEENNITDEDYDRLVKDFIASNLTLTDSSTNTTYSVSWDLYQEAKEQAKKFDDMVEPLRAAYNELLLSAKYTQTAIDSMDSLSLVDNIHTALYNKYLKDNGTSKTNFEIELKDEIASVLGISYTEMISKRSDTTAYDSYLSKIRTKYKSILVDEFGLDAYKAGKSSIPHDTVINTILNYLIEERIGIYSEMCNIADISFETYKESRSQRETFKSYAEKMRDSAYYTLATEYSSNQIYAFSNYEIDTVIYDIMFRTGFYTNIMARYVGKELGGRNGYMIAKSNAVNYTNAINKLISKYSNEISKLDLDAPIYSMSPIEVEDIIYSIVYDKNSTEFVKLESILTEVSNKYLSQIETTNDIKALVETASKELSNNALFNGVVGTIAKEVSELLAAE